jgi:diamine N-acetyltransferase
MTTPAAAIRPATATDIDWIVAQERRGDFAAFIHRWPAEQHARNLADPDKRYLIAEDAAKQRVAFVILAGLVGGNIELVRMAVTQPGAGIGKLILTAVIDLVFNELGAERLWLDVFDDNTRARRVYLAAGFRDEDVPRQPALKADGQPGSLVIMSILATHYPTLCSRA